MGVFSEKILRLINLLIYRIPELPGSAPLPSGCDRINFFGDATAFSPARSSPFVCECVSSVVVANFGSPTRDQFANGLNDPTDPDFLPGPTAFNSRRGDDIASLSPTATILRRKTAGGSRVAPLFSVVMESRELAVCLHCEPHPRLLPKGRKGSQCFLTTAGLSSENDHMPSVNPLNCH